MNKQDLIHKIAEGAGITQKDAAAALDSTLEAIVSARVGRNPATKEAIEIPASTAPVFKAGKAFKDAVK